MSYVELDSLCALFGLERAPARAARQALQAAGAIEKVMTELNERLGRQWNCKVTLAVSIHLGRAVVGEVGASDPPTVIAIGEAVDAANELRKAAAARGAAFAISQAVYAAAGVEPPPAETIMVASASAAAAIPTVLSAAAPALPAPVALGREPRAALQRLLGQ
jgi:adenylate cyclase